MGKEICNGDKRELFISQLSPCPTRILPQGELNENSLLQDEKGNLYVRRVPKGEQRILSAIYYEYEELCFYQTGGFFTVRLPQEQVSFMQECAQRGLPVVHPFYFDRKEDAIFLPYIHGIPYNKYINQSPANMQKVIGAYLKSISEAHSQGIIYGDRWGPNTIVTLAEELIHIDFDLALHGEGAKEFEISQAMYYSLYFASDRSLAIRSCKELMNSHIFEMYNLGHVKLFMMMHALYFGSGVYGGIAPDVQEVLSESIQ